VAYLSSGGSSALALSVCSSEASTRTSSSISLIEPYRAPVVCAKGDLGQTLGSAGGDRTALCGHLAHFRHRQSQRAGLFVLRAGWPTHAARNNRPLCEKTVRLARLLQWRRFLAAGEQLAAGQFEWRIIFDLIEWSWRLASCRRLQEATSGPGVRGATAPRALPELRMQAL